MDRINVDVGGTYVPFFFGCDDVTEDFVDFCNANHFDFYTEVVTVDEAKAVQENLSFADAKIKDDMIKMFVAFLEERNW